MKRSIVTGLFAVVYFLNGIEAIGQPFLDGPTCVLSGAEYQYNIRGNIPNGAQVCITGGTISGSSINCITSINPGYVRVVWNGIKGSISFTSSAGNVSKEVSITQPLQPGSITTNKEQYIAYNALPSLISCSKPTGGGCGGLYSFQWQRSLDNLKWEDIAGATNQNVSVGAALTQTFFYRRKTTENNSGTIAYSDAAVVYVAPEIKGN